LLFFSVPLGNPDRWLGQHVHRLRWLWTPSFSLCLGLFLTLSLVYGIRHAQEFTATAINLWQRRDFWLMLAFGLMSLFVVSIHELGHAFTLKHFDRVVPEVGLMFMFLFPAAYTNTTDQYALTRQQRALVVGAGIICQVTLAAIGFWLWYLAHPATWLHTTGYLLMVAGLMTITVNLNPLTKFDGYYLAVALSGINNLRSRSFQFYTNLLQRNPVQEPPHHWWIFTLYAPASLAYSLLVLIMLLISVASWTAIHIPIIAVILLTLWAIYYYFPTRHS
jgi:putative peptide zinc metalloprotease protein